MDAGLWGSAGASTVGATHGGLGPWYAAIAGIGMIVAAMYLLLMVGRVVWGPLVEPHGHGGHGHGHGKSDHGADHHDDAEAAGPLPADLTTREIAVLTPLAILCVVLGVYPKPLLATLEGPVNQTVHLIDSARSMGLQLDAPAHTTSPATQPATTPAHGGAPTQGHAQ
jgi:NADH-quinone oxidoreductase subunit M